ATAAEFVHVLLKDSTLDPSLRNEMLQELGQTGGGLFSVKRLPVDEALGSTAMTLARSEKVDERRAGAALLGGVSSPGSRIELLRMLAEDSDTNVKVVAIRSLSYVGDPATRKVLQPYAAQTADASIRKAAEAAIAELEKGPR
ncbi:MAG TPA: HEAT repeat domain-containing protein, partial [Planctomycetota bacterium]|nr:HEAT repeat domain-containing protein [Planctomycetota bacterium]